MGLAYPRVIYTVFYVNPFFRENAYTKQANAVNEKRHAVDFICFLICFRNLSNTLKCVEKALEYMQYLAYTYTLKYCTSSFCQHCLKLMLYYNSHEESALRNSCDNIVKIEHFQNN